MEVLIGTCQLPDIQGNIPASLAQITNIAQGSTLRKPDILCFPECYLQGYTRDRNIADQRALTTSDTPFQSILTQLRHLQPILVIGFIERKKAGLYNSAAIIHQGQLLGIYRKAHPHEGIFKPGSEFPVFMIKNAVFGVNICNDANFPETTARLVAQKANIIIYPLNNRLPTSTAETWRHKHLQNLQDRAKQTGAWIVSSDIIHQDAATIAYGCTAIVNPSGQVLTKAPELQYSVQYATLSVAKSDIIAT